MKRLVLHAMRRAGWRKPTSPLRHHALSPDQREIFRDDWFDFARRLWENGSAKQRWQSDEVFYAPKPVTFTRCAFSDSAKTSRGLIASATLHHGLRKYVFYPQLADFQPFFEATSAVLHRGPSEWVPGSVGSINVHVGAHYSSNWRVDYIQAHFKTGQPPIMTRKLATQYGGWRLALLDQLFADAKTARVESVILPQLQSHIRSANAIKDTLAVLRRAASAHGFTVSTTITSHGRADGSFDHYSIKASRA